MCFYISYLDVWWVLNNGKSFKKNWDSKKWKAYFTESVWFEGTKNKCKIIQKLSGWETFQHIMFLWMKLCSTSNSFNTVLGIQSNFRTWFELKSENKSFTLQRVSWLGLLWTQESIKYCFDNNSLQVLPMVSHYDHLILVKCQSMAPSFLSYI